jgi:transcriptional regulator with XRE-family HTH domain
MLFANKIKQLREEQNLLQRQLAAALEIDTPMYSKIERGDRRAKREQISLLAKELHANPEELLILWLADQVVAVVENDKRIVDKVLDVTKENIRNTHT